MVTASVPQLPAGHESSDEVDPEGAEFNPAHTSPLAPIAQHPTSAVPPGAEAALQALDRAFGVAPLPILSSLSGASLPCSASIPVLLILVFGQKQWVCCFTSQPELQTIDK